MANVQMVRRGILLMNLGSPDSTRVPDVKRYLDEFLMDKKVMDYPYLLRLLIVKGLITPRRASNSAEAYKKIWWNEGSPLIVLTEQLRDALAEGIDEPVEIAMRYGNPHPTEAFKKLMEQVPELEEVVAIPLYPHYAMASYETAVDSIKELHKKRKYPFRLTVMRTFYKNPEYIHALAESIKPYLQKEFDYILFSYHGLPERHIRKSDITGNHCLQSEQCCFTESASHPYCYRHQVLTTMEMTAKELGLSQGQYGFSFQSRLGKEWLRPYTVDVLKELPQKGIKKLLVVCPAFVADCLETLGEMGIEGKEIFLQAGGESFEAIPCMNTQTPWVDALKSWMTEYKAGNERMMLRE